jgi:hypothetical protein
MERIVAILEKINRTGMVQVIEYMRKSNYAIARCNSHHTYKGGLVDHSLEVYNLMMERRGNIPEESIAICAFLHDLGKTHLAGYNFRGHHPQRAMLILGKCGLYLNDDEQLAIAQHHSPNLTYFTHPLRHCLSSSDMSSTGKWKEEHTSPNKSHMRRFRDGALYKFSTCKL